MDKKKNTPRIRFAGFNEPWVEGKYNTTFDSLPNNTLSRANLNYNSGLAKNIHYGDVLIKFKETLDINKESIPYVNDDDFINKFISSKLQSGDVIIADAAEDETVGKCTELLNVGEELIFSGLHTIPIRPKQIFSQGYLGYFMNSTAYHAQLLKLMQGTKVLSISKLLIQNTTIYFPLDTKEQAKIGSFFQNLDNLIELNQQKHDKLINIKKACIEKMFPKDGANVPEVRFAGFTEPWVEMKLEDIGEIVTGSTPSTQIQSYYSEDGVPWVTPTDISDNITLHTARYLSEEGKKVARLVPKNTILVTSIASIGKNTLLGRSGSFNQQINGLIPKEQKYCSYFLYTESTLWSKTMSQTASNGTMQIVNKTEFSELRTRISSFDEQIKLGNFFKNLDDLIELNKKRLEKLKNIKKAMLEKMFVGEHNEHI